MIDGFLNVLEITLLFGALGGNIGDLPGVDRRRLVGNACDRPRLYPVPGRHRLARWIERPRQAQFLLAGNAVAHGIREAIDRVGGGGLTGQDVLDRPHIVGIGHAGQFGIGPVGIDDPALLIRRRPYPRAKYRQRRV